MKMKKTLEPLVLAPAGKGYLWGGERLKTEYNKDLQISPLAETWECSVHPDGPSTVMNGEYAGRKLNEVIEERPDLIGSKSDTFPILVKFIDAAKDLSVHVHPDYDYA